MHDFTEAEQHMIGAMLSASKSYDPLALMGVAAAQDFACLAVKLEPMLTTDQMVTIFGCGAILFERSKREMEAAVMASVAIAKAKP
jgi:hypothetical protein